MPRNPFFENYSNFNEQQLIDELVIESIAIHGIETYYVNKTLDTIDEVLNEDDTGIFNAAFDTVVYVKSIDGFEGDGDFLSKFGLQVKDQATFVIAIRTFEMDVTRHNNAIQRPMEGGLIYMPMSKKFFEISHVEHESVFYQSGALQVFELKCDLFEYSGQRFNTGIAEIDKHFDGIRTENIEDLETLFDVDPIAKNVFFEDEGNDIIDFSESDPFSESITVPKDRKT